jgi:hypothetical protein
MAKLTWKELATEINAPTTAAAQARWTALGYTKVCSRCGGTGRFSYNQIDGDRCYGCSGLERQLIAPTPALVAEAKARIAAGALEAYFAENARRRQVRGYIAKMRKQAEEIYNVIGLAYDAAYRAKYSTGETIPALLWDLQTENNAIFFTRLGEVQFALESGSISADEAAPFYEAALVLLTDLRDRWLASVAW